MVNHASLYANVSRSSLLVPAVRNSDTNSTGLDLQNCDDAVLCIYLGDSADTLNSTNKIEVEIEESDDDSTYTDCADATITNYVTGTNTGTVALIDAAAEDQVLLQVGYKGTKRYIRAVLNFSGTHSTGIPCAVWGERGRLRANPANSET